MVQALTALAGAFSNQEKRVTQRPQMPSVAVAMSQGKTRKESRALAKAAREDRLMYLLSQPELIGILMTLAGIYASNNIPFSDNADANNALQSIATTSSVLIGLGHAGVGDMTTAVVAGLAGIVSLGTGPGAPNIGSDWYKFLFPWGGLWATLT